MEEQRFWVVHCKICGKVHMGQPIIPHSGTYLENTMPLEGKVECPENPGQWREYLGYEWTALTQSELDALLKK
jgi:hypothetical protein